MHATAKQTILVPRGRLPLIALAHALFLLLLQCRPSPAHADIIVHDVIAVKGKETTLAAETQGKFSNRGGELVEFFVGKASLGTVLSGGDGFAYKRFTPRTTGLERVVVRSGREEGTGLLLSLGRGTGIVFVDVGTALMEGAFSHGPRPGSQKALASMSRRFPVVLLQSAVLGLEGTRQWLRDQGFEALPVLPWRQGALFDELAGAGFRIRAVVGAKPVIDSARSHRAELFSFDEVENAREVKSWDEISRSLGRP